VGYVLLWIPLAGCAASLGLWFSVTRPSTQSAMLATLSAVLALLLAYWLSLFDVPRHWFSGSQLEMLATPVNLFLEPFTAREFSKEPSRLIINGKVDTFYSVAGAILLSGVPWCLIALLLWKLTNDR